MAGVLNGTTLHEGYLFVREWAAGDTRGVRGLVFIVLMCTRLGMFGGRGWIFGVGHGVCGCAGGFRGLLVAGWSDSVSRYIALCDGYWLRAAGLDELACPLDFRKFGPTHHCQHVSLEANFTI